MLGSIKTHTCNDKYNILTSVSLALDEKLSLRGVSGIWNTSSHHFLTWDYSSGPPFQSNVSYCEAVMVVNTQW